MAESKSIIDEKPIDISRVDPSTENLAQYIKSINTCYSSLVSGLRSCYNEGDSSNENYIKLRGSITSDAIIYSKEVIPVLKNCLIAAKDLIADFGSIYKTPEEFLNKIDCIAKELSDVYLSFRRLTKMQFKVLKNVLLYSMSADELLKYVEKSKMELKMRLEKVREERERLRPLLDKIESFGGIIPVLGISMGIIPLKDRYRCFEEEEIKITVAMTSIQSDEQASLILTKILVPPLKGFEIVLMGLTKIFYKMSDDANNMVLKRANPNKSSSNDLHKAERFLNDILPISKEVAFACGFCLQTLAVKGYEFSEIEKCVNEKKGSWVDEWKVRHAENKKTIGKELAEIMMTNNEGFTLSF